MFDFIKTNNPYFTPIELVNNPLLSFNIEVDKNGEILKRISEYQNFKFIIKNEKYININGSLHKFFNGGIHNHNDYTIKNHLEVCNKLTELFRINPFNATIHNIEFGVNIIIPFNTNDFLNSIILYKVRECETETFGGKGYLLRFTFDHYQLKIYNKQLQYSLDESLIRFEIKVTKMEFFKKRNISLKTLSDTLKNENYPILVNLLLNAYSDLLIYDNSINLKKLNQRDKNTLLLGNNPKYWKEQIINGKEIKKKRTRFKLLVSKYGKRNIYKTVFEIIRNKAEGITRVTPELQTNIDDYLNSFKIQTYPKVTNFRDETIIGSLPKNNTSNKGLNPNHYCISCGRDISHQKKGSKFCSELLFGKEAKRCRNIDSNPRNNYIRKEERIYPGLLLFDSGIMSSIKH